jgi:hypothetical protein
MAIIMLITWYISSGATLFSNKYILSQLNGDALLLGIQKKTIFVLYLLLSFKVQINLLYL